MATGQVSTAQAAPRTMRTMGSFLRNWSRTFVVRFIPFGASGHRVDVIRSYGTGAAARSERRRSTSASCREQRRERPSERVVQGALQQAG